MDLEQRLMDLERHHDWYGIAEALEHGIQSAQDSTVIIAGRLLDPVSGRVAVNERILVVGGRIARTVFFLVFAGMGLVVTGFFFVGMKNGMVSWGWQRTQCRVLTAQGFPDPWGRAIMGHGNYTGVPRDTPLAKALFAVDELCGFLVACALVRPEKSLVQVQVASVKKKLKDKAFARGVNREDVIQGAAELGLPLDDHIAFVLEALKPHEASLGLGLAT